MSENNSMEFKGKERNEKNRNGTLTDSDRNLDFS